MVDLPLEFSLPGPAHRYFVVDVFTDVPCAGNQLAVFTDGRAFATEQMQSITREMNLAETVFLLPPSVPDADMRARIFTPGAELPFAGHPTLGTAFVVGEALGLDDVRLELGVGVVPVALRRENGRVVFGRMQQPIPTPEPFPREDELIAALGIEGSLLPVEQYRNGPLHVFVNLASEDEVAALRPNPAALEALGDEVCANVFAASGTRVKTRMFGVTIGITEDPATGSAAGPLAIHLARYGKIAWGEEIEISQGAEIMRPSKLFARAVGTASKIERVEVGGSAVIVARAELHL